MRKLIKILNRANPDHSLNIDLFTFSGIDSAPTTYPQNALTLDTEEKPNANGFQAACQFLERPECEADHRKQLVAPSRKAS